MADVLRDESPDDARPWEEPGAVRRDYEPHRTRLLLTLGGAALACAGLAAFLTALALWECIGGWLAPDAPGRRGLAWWFLVGIAWWLALIGAVVGVPACLTAQEDAGGMRQGRMDPAGLTRTERAASWGRVGAALGAGVVLFWPAAALCLLFLR